MLPALPDADEPERLAAAAKKLGLRYIVVTSVTRDDLHDGGAGHFKAVIDALKKCVPGADIEVLTPDFNGDQTALMTVLDAAPSVFNHNIETVERLTPAIRNRASYSKSLAVLTFAASYNGGKIPVKSGIMAGLGENDNEIVATMHDLYSAGVSILTIGQYLPPSGEHWPLDRYVEPDKFKEWAETALKIGFKFVASAPLVRSSYHAAELVLKK
jgi:lipoic acid synthetase